MYHETAGAGMLLIDAYNVLHCSHLLPDRHAMVDPAGLCALIRRTGIAGRGRGDRGERAVVVCDGVRKPHEHADTGEEGVRLVYAGPGGDADSLIERMIDRATVPRRLVVVSNDRRLQRAARRRRASPMASETFIRRLANLLRGLHQPSDPAEKPTTADAATWMQKFGIEEGDDVEAAEAETETDRWLRAFGYEQGKRG